MTDPTVKHQPVLLRQMRDWVAYEIAVYEQWLDNWADWLDLPDSNPDVLDTRDRLRCARATLATLDRLADEQAVRA